MTEVLDVQLYWQGSKVTLVADHVVGLVAIVG